MPPGMSDRPALPSLSPRSLLRDRDRASEPLDAIKWLCREFWTEAFRKPVDRLQTNNRGVYVLHDGGFRWARSLSGDPGDDSRALALKYFLVPCGLLRGALAAWGLDAVINVDISGLPRAVFHVRLPAFAGGTTGGSGGSGGQGSSAATVGGGA